jgi:hypothetical protein
MSTSEAQMMLPHSQQRGQLDSGKQYRECVGDYSNHALDIRNLFEHQTKHHGARVERDQCEQRCTSTEPRRNNAIPTVQALAKPREGSSASIYEIQLPTGHLTG